MGQFNFFINNSDIFTMKKIFLIEFILMFLFSQNSFSFLSSETKIKLHSIENGSITDLATQNKQELLKNNDTELTISTPLQVDILGHLPVILIPLKEGTTDIKLQPPSYKDAINTYGQNEISHIVSKMFIDIQLVQKKIQLRDLSGAMSTINELQKNYPNVAFLDFIKGSILFLQGQKSEARTAIKKALEAHPDYEEGQKFLKSIGDDGSSGEKHE